MRDLEQLRERSDESTGRKIGLFALAALLSIAAAFAMGLMLRGGDTQELESELDPLAELARTSAQAAAATAPEAAPVKPESLSFPSTLLDREEAMLEATIRAAEREHAALTGRAGVERGELPEVVRPSIADLPAGSLATESSARLSRVARHDPLVAETLPSPSRGSAAPVGHEGAYTLQVVSYEDRHEAQTFASALRARGHKAFVAEADVPDRGRFYRVRIGPFTTRREAIGYQTRFEELEHMHTILVSNPVK